MKFTFIFVLYQHFDNEITWRCMTNCFGYCRSCFTMSSCNAMWRCVKFSYYCVIGKDTHGKWEISSRPPWSRMSHCWISWVNWFKNIIWSILCAFSCHKSVEKCFCVCHCEVLIIDCIQIYKGLLLIITLNI